jgi:hypothetical protein
MINQVLRDEFIPAVEEDYSIRLAFNLNLKVPKSLGNNKYLAYSKRAHVSFITHAATFCSFCQMPACVNLLFYLVV